MEYRFNLGGSLNLEIFYGNNIEQYSLTYNPNFKNGNLKYLLITTQYPKIDLLKNYISFYEKKKKSLSILKAFTSKDQRISNIWKLYYIKTINDFINSFSEENSNIITIKTEKTDIIDIYLSEIRNRNKTKLDKNDKT